MSIKNPANDEFIKKWSAYAKAKKHCRAQGQAADQRPDGSHLHRRQHVEAGGRKGQVHRRRQGRLPAMAGQTFKAPSGIVGQDGREEPPPAQAGVHRRNQGRRPVQRGVEDAWPGQGQALEPVHRRTATKKTVPNCSLAGGAHEGGRARTGIRASTRTCTRIHAYHTLPVGMCAAALRRCAGPDARRRRPLQSPG